MFVYYIIGKNYKGIFSKKHTGNMFYLFCPISPDSDDYAVFCNLGPSDASMRNHILVLSLSTKRPENIINIMKKSFGSENFKLLDKIKIEEFSYKGDEEDINIKLEKKGKYLGSDKYTITYDSYLSQNMSSPIFILKGKIYGTEEDVPISSLRIEAKKNIAKLQGILGNTVAFFKNPNVNPLKRKE